MAADPARFADLFALFGPVTVRRMFGAEGLFRDGVMFGIVYRERIYFKTSEESRKAFVAEGATALYYEFKNAEGILTSYYELPDRLYDDPGELAEWAKTALGVAHVAPGAKKKRVAARKNVMKKKSGRGKSGAYSPLKRGSRLSKKA